MSERQPPTEDLRYQAMLMERALEFLGRKWALLVVRDVAFLGLTRFGEILRNNKGLTPRMLSRRLNELTREGVLKRLEDGSDVRYEATDKALDALYILFAFLRYGLRHMYSPQDVKPDVGRPG